MTLDQGMQILVILGFIAAAIGLILGWKGYEWW